MKFSIRLAVAAVTLFAVLIACNTSEARCGVLKRLKARICHCHR